MNAYPAWTPASRPGIIPLHPLGFGTILGTSFSALRHNPKVMLGFALGVQAIAYLAVVGGVAAVALWSYSRLDTLQEGTDEFNAVFAGATALTIVTALVLTLAVGALGVIVQGIVVSEVAHAVLAEKLTLGRLWARVRPVAWRLIGYTLLLTTALLVLIAVVVAGVVAIGTLAVGAAIGLAVLLVLAAIPLTLWISTKLLLVPAVLVLERARIGDAIVRSWTLIRGRFWPALGIIVVISLIMGTLAQVVSVPFSILSVGMTTIFTPTGDPEPSAIIGVLVGTLLTQVVTLLVQAVTLVVQGTASSLIYIDCRMRREGLDLDLLAYVEQRDAGAALPADPYAPHPQRVRPPAATYAGAYGYALQAPPPGYGPAPGYLPGPGYPPPAAPQANAAPAASGTAAASVPPAPPAPPVVPAVGQAPDATSWVAPGGEDGTDRESPWA